MAIVLMIIMASSELVVEGGTAILHYLVQSLFQLSLLDHGLASLQCRSLQPHCHEGHVLSLIHI